MLGEDLAWATAGARDVPHFSDYPISSMMTHRWRGVGSTAPQELRGTACLRKIA